jgi:transposase
MKGNHQKATEKYIEILLKTIEKEPSELGYEFARWSAQRLATYLEEKTGILLSSSQVRRILERKKYAYCRPSLKKFRLECGSAFRTFG